MLFIMLAFSLGTKEVQAQGTISSSYINLAGGGGRLTVTINVSVLRWNELQVEVSSEDMTGDFKVLTAGWALTGISQDPLGRWLLGIQRQLPATGIETVIIEGPEGRGRQGTIILLQNGARQMSTMNAPTFLGVEISPPGGGLLSTLKRFDANGNNLIDDGEFFAIIDAWIAGQLDNDTFFKAVDLWVSQSPIGSAGVDQKPLMLDSLSVTPVRGAMTFIAQGRNITSTGVQIFDLNGKPIFDQETSGTRLTWNLSAADGQVMANGVYLYIVKAKGYDGKVIRTEIRKLVIKR